MLAVYEIIQEKQQEQKNFPALPTEKWTVMMRWEESMCQDHITLKGIYLKHRDKFESLPSPLERPGYAMCKGEMEQKVIRFSLCPPFPFMLETLFFQLDLDLNADSCC